MTDDDPTDAGSPDRWPGPPVTSRELSAGQILGYLAFSHGWTWAFWALAASQGTSIWEPPAVWFFYLGGAGVVLGGLVMTRLTYGSAGLRELGRRLVDVGRIPGRWWLVILVLFPALKVAGGGVAAAVGVPGPIFDFQAAHQAGADPAAFLVTAGFIFLMGPLPEEIGWRGYLQDRLQARWSALAASLAVAGAWWLWHLPLFALPGYYDAFASPPPGPWMFLLGLVPTAILYAWVYNNTGRSLFAVIAVHFVDNLSGELLGMSSRADPYTAGTLLVAAVVVVYLWGPATLCRGAETAA